MRRLSLRIVAILLSISVIGCAPRGGDILISVNVYVQHPNLDATLAGFREVVDEWGRKSGKRIKYDVKNAGGDMSTALQIARQQVGQQHNLILALATPSAQSTVRTTSQIPVVFGAITDPVAAGLVRSLEAPGGNVTGTTDLGPYGRQFELIRQLMPSARVVGIIRNPGEANSVASMVSIDRAIVDNGFRKIEVAVSNTAEVLAAARSLVGRCDVFYMPADNTVLSALASVIGVAESRKIPLFVGDEGSVRLGGIATIGIDYHDLGRITGELAIQILEGAHAGALAVRASMGSRVIVNPTAAARQGLTIPSAVLDQAIIVSR